MIVLDNMLMGGEVLEPENSAARAIAELNRVITEDDRVTNVLLTVRDGLMLVWKRAV